MKYAIVVVPYALALSLGASAHAAPISSTVGAGSLQKIGDSVVRWKLTPGISLAVVANGKVAYTGVSGITDLESKRPVTIESRFPIGSLGTLFLAVAMVQLDAKHKLHLDDPLERYMPEAPAGITLRQLLPPQSDGDEKYDALGAVIERASGEPLLTYLTEHVFRPAGMTQTWFGEPPGWLPLALGYLEWRDVFSAAAPEANAWNRKCCSYLSTARDLARFSVALLNGTLVSSASLQALEAAFQSAQKGGMRVIGQMGSPAGYDAQLALVPRERFAMVTLTNCSGFPATVVLDRVFATYFPAAAVASAAANTAENADPAITARLSQYFTTQTSWKGPVPAMEFLSSSESAGSTEYRYLVDAPGGTKSAFFVVSADDKIDGFWVH